jgi:DNA-binding SARP family transcriptional activator
VETTIANEKEVHYDEPDPDSALSRGGPCAATLKLRILGPLEVLEDGCTLPLAGKMVRALLVALLLHAREVRTTDQLIDDLWGDRAPATARASLHNKLSTLRRMLGHELLETNRAGYLLSVCQDQVDVSCFEGLIARARRENPGEKVRLLEAALALWRGSPLLDVRYEDFAQGEIRRLEELHVSALEELFAAKLELGACAAVVPELQRLVENFPFREQLRMQLMLALYRSGRSVEALASYDDWRRTLVDWSLEPGRDIRRLWDDIRLRAPGLEVAVTN